MQYELLCNNSYRPLSVVEDPCFSWKITHSLSCRQKAYRLCIASQEDRLDDPDVYDSKTVYSSKSADIHVKCKLRSNCRYWWSVNVTDDTGAETVSPPEYFETAIVNARDWKAEWINAGEQYITNWAMVYSFSFDSKKVIRAKAFVCGLGAYEFVLNGKKVGNRLLEPAQTDYNQRVMVSVYDVKEFIESQNTIHITVGDGWYHQSQLMEGEGVYGDPCLFFQMELQYENGDSRTICSSGDWQVSYSATNYNNIYIGEHYDARIEPFAQNSRFSACVCQGPGGILVPQQMPPVQVMKEITPKSLKQHQQGVYVYDFGENMAGIIRLKAHGWPGNQVVMRFAETVDENGNLDVDSTGVFHIRNVQTLTYTFGQQNDILWEPRFTYFGFRYVELTGLHYEPDEKTLTALKIYSGLEKSSDFDCSWDVLNTMHEIVCNTFTSNIHGVPTDCPAREKCGWTGDTNIVGDFILPMYSAQQFYDKYIGDIITSHNETGTYYNIVPGKRRCGETVPAWGSVLITLPWNCYMEYGCLSMLEKYYPEMKKYVEFMRNHTTDYLCDSNPYPLGDWCAPYGYDSAEHYTQINTAFYFLSVKIMSQTSTVLGYQEDERHWTALMEEIKTAYNKAFYNAKQHTYGTQTLNAMCENIGLCEEGQGEQLAHWCNEDIKQHDYHITCGHIGMRYIFGMLNKYGYFETIGKVLNNEEPPSIKAQINIGATTLWETPSMDTHGQSLNHPFKGGYCKWIYEDVLGIKKEEPGYKVFSVRPSAVSLVSKASGFIDTVHGRISITYSLGEYIKISVPFNTAAKLFLPGSEPVLLTSGDYQFDF